MSPFYHSYICSFCKIDTSGRNKKKIVYLPSESKCIPLFPIQLSNFKITTQKLYFEPAVTRTRSGTLLKTVLSNLHNIYLNILWLLTYPQKKLWLPSGHNLRFPRAESLRILCCWLVKLKGWSDYISLQNVITKYVRVLNTWVDDSLMWRDWGFWSLPTGDANLHPKNYSTSDSPCFILMSKRKCQGIPNHRYPNLLDILICKRELTLSLGG